MNISSETIETLNSVIHHAPTGKTQRGLSARQKKIEKLKSKISNGKYRVSNFDLAKALILSL